MSSPLPATCAEATPGRVRKWALSRVHSHNSSAGIDVADLQPAAIVALSASTFTEAPPVEPESADQPARIILLSNRPPRPLRAPEEFRFLPRRPVTR